MPPSAQDTTTAPCVHDMQVQITVQSTLLDQIILQGPERQGCLTKIFKFNIQQPYVRCRFSSFYKPNVDGENQDTSYNKRRG